MTRLSERFTIWRSWANPASASIPLWLRLSHCVTVLTKYAVRFRYPGAPYEPNVEEAQESIGLAREFVDTVLAQLPEGLLEENW
jgi:hypothetical protein